MKSLALRGLPLVLLAMGLCVAASRPVYAANAAWNVNASGNWTDDGDWNATHPDGVDDVALIADPSVVIDADRTITLDTNITVGTLNINYAFDSTSDNFAIGNSANTLTFDVSSGNAMINKTAGRLDEISAPIVLNDTLDINHTGGSHIRFTGEISGNAGINRLGPGEDAFSGGRIIFENSANSYTGDTNIIQGRLRATVDGAVPHGAGKGNVSIGTLGGLELNNGITYTINGLSGDGTVVHGAGDGTAISLAVGDNNATSTFAGVIRVENEVSPGTRLLNLEKIGTGILTLDGNNTYNGTTTVSAGTLLINGTHSSPSGSTGDYTVSSGGTLGGRGIIDAIVHVAGGTLSPGTSPDTLTLGGANGGGGLVLADNASFDYELDPSDMTVGGGVNDLLDVNGTLDVSADPTGLTLNVQAVGGGDLAAAGTWTLALYDALNPGSGTPAFAINGIGSGYTASIGVIPDDGGDPLGPGSVVLNVQVPEPASFALLAVSLAGLGLVFRRRGR